MEAFIISAGNKWRAEGVLAKYAIDHRAGGEGRGARGSCGGSEGVGGPVGGCR